MHYVYILKSQKNKDRFYIGVTNSLERRLKQHASAKGDSYTVRHAPS
ncbi:MAG: GIY-YIG nuclease family protein [Candidatus Omnitrophica bacterium]|nr:GIY-YIG nuclease family protein [Candidatus Omnitrophota bacterium]